jgi:hypothetical protein
MNSQLAGSLTCPITGEQPYILQIEWMRHTVIANDRSERSNIADPEKLPGRHAPHFFQYG